MKYIRNYKSFKGYKNPPVSENYYYSIGKKTQKTILECGLISEGVSIETVRLLNESIDFKKIDNQIVDAIWESLSNSSKELVLEGWGNIIDGAKNLWDKGVSIGKTVFNSFKDFIAKIGDVIKTIFGKIKAFFSKIWELFKPKIIAAAQSIKKSVSGAMGAGIDSLSKLIKDKGTGTEISELSKDVNGAVGKFSTGSVGNMSPDAEKHLADEAEEYKDVEDTSDIEKLIADSFQFEKKTILKKVYLSLKGYLSEGNSLTELSGKLNEAEEFKQGDKVKYTNKQGEEVEKEILRVEGENAFFTAKDGSEFSKKIGDLSKKDAGSKDGKGSSKKGMFGWICEAVGFVLSPLSKLKDLAIKAGANGIAMGISSLARGFGKHHKYVIIGTICGLVYHIVHGALEVIEHFTHEEMPEAQKGQKSPEGQDVPDAQDAAKDTAKKAKSVIDKKTFAPNPVSTGPNFTKSPINLKKESMIFEGATVDLSKGSKFTDFLSTSKEILIPVAGGLLVQALLAFFPTIKIILEMILVSIGVFELVGALCEASETLKSTSVCSLHHSAEHFLGGSSGH
jgi:hypothetical protein